MPSFLVRKVLLCKAAGRMHIKLTIKQRLYILPRSSWLKFGYSKSGKEILITKILDALCSNNFESLCSLVTDDTVIMPDLKWFF
jgi:hypothetical protein